jgi:hypothetical protein
LIVSVVVARPEIPAATGVAARKKTINMIHPRYFGHLIIFTYTLAAHGCPLDVCNPAKVALFCQPIVPFGQWTAAAQ